MRAVPSASLSGEHTPFLICIVPWDFRVPRILSTLKCCQSFRLSRLDVRSAQDLPMGKSSFCCLLRLSLFPSCPFAKLKAAWAIARKTSGDMRALVFESRLPLCDFFFFFHKAAFSTLCPAHRQIPHRAARTGQSWVSAGFKHFDAGTPK